MSGVELNDLRKHSLKSRFNLLYFSIIELGFKFYIIDCLYSYIFYLNYFYETVLLLIFLLFTLDEGNYYTLIAS